MRKVSARPALHLLSALVPVAYAYGAGRVWVIVLLGGAVIVAVVVELLRRTNKSVRAVFQRWAGPLLRDYEHGGLTAATWLALALFAATALLPRGPAVAAMWSAAAGDPMAALVGTAWRARGGPSSTRGRTAAGSFAMFAVSTLGASLLAGFSPAGALIIGLAAAVAERAGGRVNDNVTVTLGAALAAMVVT